MEANFEATFKRFLQEAKAVQRNFPKCLDSFRTQVDSENRRYNDYLIQKKDSEDILKILNDEIQTAKCQNSATADEIEQYANEEQKKLEQLPQLERELEHKYDCRVKLKKTEDNLENRIARDVKLRNILENYFFNNEYFQFRINEQSPNVYRISFAEKNAEADGFVVMKYNDRKNQFVVFAHEPKGLIPDFVMQKFHQVQDTQGLLHYLRKRLLNS